MFLQDLIVKLLKEKQIPLSGKEIFDIIKQRELWNKIIDGSLPSLHQIHARISKHPELFKRENGLIKLRVEQIRKFLRLTWNENYWEFPSGHPWKKQNQNNSNIPYENQYGFGHEEWLFNPRYKINDYQYGYIRGLDLKSEALDFLSNVYLYSIRKLGSLKEPFYLGYINNLQIIKHNAEEQNKILPIIHKHFSKMISELKNVGADYNPLQNGGFIPTVKFKLMDAHICDEPISIPDFNLSTYKRFQPFDVNDSIETLFKKAEKQEETNFSPGKAKQTDNYKRLGKEVSTEVKKMHSEIISELEKYLAPIYTLSNKNISIEKTRFSGNIADVVLLNSDKTHSIYEVKTSSNARRNIREAIGQLLDYATHSAPLVIRDLTMVSPSKLNVEEIAFFQTLQQKVKFRLKYLEYNRDNSEKFLLHE